MTIFILEVLVVAAPNGGGHGLFVEPKPFGLRNDANVIEVWVG
jgi:hypothetical protein